MWLWGIGRGGGDLRGGQGRWNAVLRQREGGREGFREEGMRLWSIGEGVGGWGAMLRGVQGSGYAIMGHRCVGREGHKEVGMRFWGIGKGVREGPNEV